MKPNYYKILKIFAQVVGFFIVVFLLLNIAGKLFIQEISQNLFIKEEVEGVDVVEINDPAPYFELQNLKGKLIKITDFKGSPLVVVFWNTWNDISVSQIEIINNISSEKNPLFNVLAVNSQEPKNVVSSFVERGLYLDTEILLDTNGGVSDLYEARNAPVFYFINKNGLLINRHNGFLDENQIVEKMYQTQN